MTVSEVYTIFILCYNIILSGDVDGLVQHALVALRECLPSDAELTSKVVHSIMIIPSYPHLQ